MLLLNTPKYRPVSRAVRCRLEPPIRSAAGIYGLRIRLLRFTQAGHNQHNDHAGGSK